MPNRTADQLARPQGQSIPRLPRRLITPPDPAGAVWPDQDEDGHVPAPAPTAVVDTTGAGDAFVGALAVELAAGTPLEDAVRLGVRAGTFAVQSLGAQSSDPTPADL